MLSFIGYKYAFRCDLYLLLFHKVLFVYILGEEYIKSLIANPELVDRLALSSDDKVNTQNFKLLKYSNPSHFLRQENICVISIPVLVPKLYGTYFLSVLQLIY